jgi:hypothetical protein
MSIYEAFFRANSRAFAEAAHAPYDTYRDIATAVDGYTEELTLAAGESRVVIPAHLHALLSLAVGITDGDKSLEPVALGYAKHRGGVHNSDTRGTNVDGGADTVVNTVMVTIGDTLSDNVDVFDVVDVVVDNVHDSDFVVDDRIVSCGNGVYRFCNVCPQYAVPLLPTTEMPGVTYVEFHRAAAVATRVHVSGVLAAFSRKTEVF